VSKARGRYWGGKLGRVLDRKTVALTFLLDDDDDDSDDDDYNEYDAYEYDDDDGSEDGEEKICQHSICTNSRLTAPAATYYSVQCTLYCSVNDT